MAEARWNRRDFGKFAAAAGVGVAASGLPAGQARADGHPVEVRGEGGQFTGGLDDVVQTYMSERSIPNGELAVVYQGRLVMARGYTLIDGSNRPLIEPTALFRLGSLSKAITAVAVIAAAEDGLLGLYDPVADYVDLTPLPGDQADPRLGGIQLWHLIHHEGGWQHREHNGLPPAYDPPITLDRTIRTAWSPWLSLPLSRQNVIQYVSGKHQLTFTPGTVHSYSNYAYLLLGQALEAVTPNGYAAWVRDRVLAPLGIDTAAGVLEGQTLATPARPGEVAYFSYRECASMVSNSNAWVPAQYGENNWENWLAGGGWVTNAVNYARFLSVYENGGGVLDSGGQTFLHAPPDSGPHDGAVYYIGGMNKEPQTNGYRWWHGGAAAGTYARVYRSAAGYTLVALFNQWDDPSGLSYDPIVNDLRTIANSLTQLGGWPAHDLFGAYL